MWPRTGAGAAASRVGLLVLWLCAARAQVLIEDGVLRTELALPFTWKWFTIPLADAGADGAADVLYNALVEVDAETLVDTVGEQAWTRFDVLVLNGSLPDNAQTGESGPVTSGNPICWVNYACNALAETYVELPRVTASFGFNHSAPGGFTPPLTNLIVGVRESGGAGSVVSFSLRVTRLPRVLTDGLVLESAVAPCEDAPPYADLATCRQYFTVLVAAYDVLHVSLVRTGDNLTWHSADGAASYPSGRGLVGGLYAGAPATRGEPPPAAFERYQPLDNATAGVEIGYFCTEAPQAGSYTIAVVGGRTADGGFGPELMTSAAEREEQVGVARQGRGRFRLVVRHAQFADGRIDGPVGARPGCVAHGQTRRYTLRSNGTGDANLYAAVAGNVSLMRARCEGCEWVEARPPIAALAASPCSMRNGTDWTLELSLAEADVAQLAGLAPTEFALHTELQNASVAPGERETSRTAGGGGYVCCGAAKSYVMPDVPREHAIAVQLNVTRGQVRAVFVKHGSCASVADVSGATCDGLCEMRWLTLYDEFYGRMEHEYGAHLALPFGPTPWEYDAATTKRRAGDWYVSVQALPGVAAEFDLEFRLLPPPRPPDVFGCSRFAGFCPQRHYHSGPARATVLIGDAHLVAQGLKSAATPRAHGGALAALAALAAAAALLGERGWRRLAVGLPHRTTVLCCAVALLAGRFLL